MSIAVGITGHQTLPRASMWDWVEEAMRDILEEASRQSHGPPNTLAGVSALAAGADQRFARLLLSLGGTLLAVIPLSDYASKFESVADRTEYEQLRAAAAEVEVLSDTDNDESAYLEAGKRVVDRADWMVAVWDGMPARGKGGTADAVAYARSRGKRLYHLNPSTQTTTLHDGPGEVGVRGQP